MEEIRDIPLMETKEIAKKYNCDLLIPNGTGTGVGNVLIYTRLVEELSRNKGRRLRILTAPFSPDVGVVKKELQYPIWENNPFIEEIVNANEIDPEIMETARKELNSYAQFNHIIENLCFCYGVRPRSLRASLFLTKKEKEWALEVLSHLKRPLVCIHPGGTTSSREKSKWFMTNWIKIIDEHKDDVGFVKIGRDDIDHRNNMDVFFPKTTLRELMAIIWASDIFIGFDSSPMHIATAFEKPVLTLFDMHRKEEAESKIRHGYSPSVVLRWGYPQNRNISILDEYNNETLTAVNRFIVEETIKLR